MEVLPDPKTNKMKQKPEKGSIGIEVEYIPPRNDWGLAGKWLGIGWKVLKVAARVSAG